MTTATKKYDLLASEPGILADWYRSAKHNLIRNGLGVGVTDRRMTFLTSQRTFWSIYTESIQQVPGLVKRKL